MPDEASFRVAIERTAAATIAKCRGRLVAGQTGILHAEISPLIPESKLIVLDLTEVTYMDSLGLGAVVRLYVSAKAAGCDLELVNFGERIRKLLDVTKLLSVFTICGENDIRIP